MPEPLGGVQSRFPKGTISERVVPVRGFGRGRTRRVDGNRGPVTPAESSRGCSCPPLYSSQTGLVTRPSEFTVGPVDPCQDRILPVRSSEPPNRSLVSPGSPCPTPRSGGEVTLS